MSGLSKILVVVDSEDPSRRRTCFWEQALRGVSGVVSTMGSFPDARDPHQPGGPEFLDFNAYDAIVLNWDVLNQDYWFRGEVTAAMINRASLGFLPKWLERGGLLVVEAQCRHWIPSQEAYEVALKKPGFRVSIHDYYDATLGTAFRAVKRYANHPFLRHCDPQCVHVFKGDVNRTASWFPSWLKHDAVFHNFDPCRTHSGGFSWIGPEWLPLLRCRFSGLPVLLCQVVGRGAIVVSTMYLASSGQSEIIRGVLEGWQRDDEHGHKVALVEFHRVRVRRRKSLDVVRRLIGPAILASAVTWYFQNQTSRFVAAFFGAGSGFLSWFLLGAVRGYLWSTTRDLVRRVAQFVATRRSGG